MESYTRVDQDLRKAGPKNQEKRGDVCVFSVGLVADEGDNHAVQVEEEHDEVEAELSEGFL